MAIKGWLNATFSTIPNLSGFVIINAVSTLDVVDYFRTEDNKHFFITEAGDHLVI